MEDRIAEYAEKERSHDRAAVLERMSSALAGSELPVVRVCFLSGGSRDVKFSTEKGGEWRLDGASGRVFSDEEVAGLVAEWIQDETFHCARIGDVWIYERHLWMGERVGEMLALLRDAKEPTAEDCLDTLDYLLPYIARRLEGMVKGQTLFFTRETKHEICAVQERLRALEDCLRRWRDENTEFYLRVVAPEQCRRLREMAPHVVF